jgi:hypothetical protein
LIPYCCPDFEAFKYYIDLAVFTMNQASVTAIIVVVAAISIAATIATSSVALAQNMSGGTPQKSKLPGNETFAGNATNTTITQGVSPNNTKPAGNQ